ncbi:MAG: capsular biosynthesis protein [Pseudomonadota bacterium]
MNDEPAPSARLGTRRTVLLLQGPASTLWPRIADALEAEGHRALHVNLSLGDWLFWRRRGALNYRGRLQDWPGWLDALCRREAVSDILYFADRLPYHRAAAAVAAELGIRAWAVENGYLRPDWLTLEPVAMGRHSRFTRDPATIGRLAAGRPRADLDPRFPVPFAVEAANEVVFNLAHVLGRLAFPRYVSDKRVAPLLEYAGWIPHLATLARSRRQAAAVERDCARPGSDHMLLALQMETDYQIRASSDYPGQTEMLEEVLASLARSAPETMRLIVKIHPFDNGLIDWRARTHRIAARHGLADRVTVIRGGRLAVLLAEARGLITINSTTAVEAMRRGCPVLPLGDALYDVPGLCHQSGLERFWTTPEPPDPQLFDDWCRALASEIQLRGSQMNRAGQAVAAAEIARRIGAAERYWQLYETSPDAPSPLAVAAE